MKPGTRLWLYLVLLPAAAASLSGCLPNFASDWFGPSPAYKLAGLEKDTPLRKEMESFLEERTDAFTSAAKSEDGKRAEEVYQEQQLRNDLAASLESHGYYDGAVTYADDKKPWKGTYELKPGAQYKISRIAVKPQKYTALLGKGLLKAPLEAEVVLAAQQKLKDAISKGKCYFDLAVDNEVTLNRKAKTAAIVFTVKAGKQAVMGPVTFEGNKNVHTSYLEKRVDWKEGDCFSRAKIEALRGGLFESGLFSAAEIILPDAPRKNGSVPVTVRVTERAARSVQAGLSYYTDEGVGLTLGWKHRNLFGGAEDFDTELKLSQIVQNLSATLSKPYFLRHDQTLALNAGLGHEDTDGYIKTGIEAGAAIKRSFTTHLSGSTGVRLSLSRIEDEATLENNNYLLLSFPQTVTYDTRDNALDAKRGWWLNGTVEPFADLAGESPMFWKAQAAARTYHAFSPKVTAAARLRVGSILGPSVGNLPATERFYAGGGGSIRGFGYQEVGPELNGEPSGGRSLIESAAELRFKITDDIGAVTFVDAGNVSDSTVPDTSDIWVGGGAGLRYYTGFGPLRFDVAVPLNRKETASASYQLYISIGQAF